MNIKLRLLVFGLAFNWLNPTYAQMTTFSYQGRLAINGVPANGLYDLNFTLYDAPSGGHIVASPAFRAPLRVTNGLFTVTIDLGASPFSGGDRWLELAARPSFSGVPLTILVPRQAITAAPYAIQAVGLSAPISAANLPGNVLTNRESQATILEGGAQVNNGATVRGGLSVHGGITLADSQFIGNGAGLTNLQVAGSSPNSLTNHQTTITFLDGGLQVSNAATVVGGVNVRGGITALDAQFNGNGAGLTALNAASISSGTVPDARLSANVALMSANQTFTGSNTFTGVSSLTNALNQFAGNGAALTALGAGNISSGTLADARLSANVALLNGNQTFAGSNTFTSANSFANAGNRFVGAFVGNGAALSNLPAGNVTVTLAGDVTGTQGATTVGRIRGVNVAATAPVANHLLRFDGANWTPAAVALG